MSRRTLLAEIDRALGNTVTPSLTQASNASDLFEAYTFGLIIEAARTEGASVHFQDVNGRLLRQGSTFVFRTSPGFIASTTHPYAFAVVDFPQRPRLEVHLGIMISGKSRVLHEADVAVVDAREAQSCRSSLFTAGSVSNSASPRSSKLEIAVECKFYSNTVPLGMARSFLGLGMDLSAKSSFFVFNNRSPSVAKLLVAKKKYWNDEVDPAQVGAVDKLKNAFCTSFSNFKAR